MPTTRFNMDAIEARVRGRVQGVGFRPMVWRCARDLGLAGEVLNDCEGVLIRARGAPAAVAALLDRIEHRPPPLARIDRIETRSYRGTLPAEFRIASSVAGEAHTEIAPDAAICAACAAEIAAPSERRYRYAFANCTRCGPRLTIIRGVPYDRAMTAMEPFNLCPACEKEYRDPADRRFHAEPIACPSCGPRLRLARFDGAPVALCEGERLDDLGAAQKLIEQGEILAIKGLGGYQLAVDATNRGAVARLRRLKKRDAKPFALMARDLDVIRRYCALSPLEECELSSFTAPIILLPAKGPERLPDAVAPGVASLGFMLPTTPLHVLLLQRFDRPLVMTSGNLADEPQATEDEEARERLGAIAAYALIHDREIANRVDDSVAREMAGKIRLIRRARGFAPSPIALPPGFEKAPEILAMGGELKSTFCLIKDGAAILSQHQGDLEYAMAFADYRRNLALYRDLFDHRPSAVAIDRHPEYLSGKLARALTLADLPLIETQHHHAHVAACLAENGYPLRSKRVLGVVLDGLGWGDDDAIWGGEFLLADYRNFERLGSLKPVAMPGGAQAVREPWRNLYAHLTEHIGWLEFRARFGALDICDDLAQKPLAVIDAMLRGKVNSPLASSCGRLFDAVAAALGLCRDRQAYEGHAALLLENLAAASKENDDDGYPFSISCTDGAPRRVDPTPMWDALLRDRVAGAPASCAAARFHRGLSQAVVQMVSTLADAPSGDRRFETVALSGGCFQNRILFEQVEASLGALGFDVLTHAAVPANDGGLSLGQAAIAAARLIGDSGDPQARSAPQDKSTRSQPCALAFPAAS